MEKALLKKAAIQSVVLMLCVILLSVAMKQYNSVAISASYIEDISPISYTNIQEINQEPIEEVEPVIITEDTVISVEPSFMFTGIEVDINKDILELLGEQFLIIRKPQGGSIQLQMEDLFISRQLKLTISGFMEETLDNSCIGRINKEEVFLGNPVYIEKEIQNEDDTAELVRDYGNDPVHEIQITGLTDDLGYSIVEVMLLLDHVYVHYLFEDEYYYYIDLKRPREVYDRILVIDAGHGGKDPGAVSKDELTYEKELNLGIVLKLKELLDKENIKVYYTRINDDKIFLRPRVNLANDVDCDFFISVHNNTNVISKKINGTEILYYDYERKNIKSKDMAKIFSEEISKTTALKNNGLVQMRNDDVLILNHAEVPAILVEGGYLSNQKDLEYLQSSDGQAALAEGIYKGILRAYDELMP